MLVIFLRRNSEERSEQQFLSNMQTESRSVEKSNSCKLSLIRSNYV